MAMARGVGSAFGIATGGESAYDSADTITHVLPATGAAVSAQGGEGFDFAGVADGYEESTNVYQTRYITPVTFTGPAMDTTLPILAAFALGSDTQASLGSVSSASHKIQPIAVSAELASTTLSVNSINRATVTLGSSIKHTGCVVDSFSFGGDVGSNGGALSCSATFQASGTTAAGTDLTTMTEATKLFVFNEVYCAMHGAANTIASGYTIKTPTDTGSAPDFSEFTTSYTNVSPYLQGFQWTVNNNLAVVEGHNTGSTLAASTMYRQQRVQDLSLTFRWSGESAAVGGSGSATLIRDLRQNIFTTYSIALYGVSRDVIDSTETTDYRYAWTLIQPSARLISVTVNPTPGIQTITCGFRILEPASGTLKSTDFYVWNKDRVDYV